MKFKNIVFDIETDGFLDRLTKVHSLVIQCLDTKEVISCANVPTFPKIEDGLRILDGAETIWGHNIMKFDLPALNKVYGKVYPIEKVRDTLVIGRLIWTNLLDLDFEKRPKGLDKGRYGRHALEDWGKRLGVFKGDFGKQTDWQNWSLLMQRYCEQDVTVNTALVEKIVSLDYSEQSIELEHKFQAIIMEQESKGVPFNTAKAMLMRDEIHEYLTRKKDELQSTVDPIVKEEVFIPKRDNRSRGYVKGVPVVKRKETPFNPGSRQQIVTFLKRKYRWNPVDFTKNGNPKVGREQLEGLTHWKEVPDLMEYLDAVKLAGQLYNGDNAWLKLTRNGRIYGKLNTNGAVTGRCTHYQPNLAQVPTPRSFKGTECRALFYAPEGYKVVGADASGLELRMLGHYLYAYDKGAYIKQILDGDIHTHNQEAAGLQERDQAKRFIYAFLYGAGDAKLGSIVVPDGSEAQQKMVGAQLKMKFFAAIPAIHRLLVDVKNAAKRRGFLRGLDGRKLHVRSEHRALNTLLQGGGAVVCKQWAVDSFDAIVNEGLRDYCYPALNVHDEVQLIARENKAEEIGECLQLTMPHVGEKLKINCPLEAEYQIGNDWSETH